MNFGPTPVDGQVIIVTGASAGIGRATAERLARSGRHRGGLRPRSLPPRGDGLEDDRDRTVPPRCHLRAGLGRPHRRGARPARPHRRPGQQRRHRLGGARRGDGVRGHRAAGEHERHRLDGPDPAGASRDARARRRTHRHDLVVGGLVLVPAAHRLQRHQVRRRGLRRGAATRGVGAAGVVVSTVNPGPVATEWLARSQGYQPSEGDQEVRRIPGCAARVGRGCDRALTARPGPTVGPPVCRG